MPRGSVWVYDPQPKKPTDATKRKVETEANDLVNSYLKPTYVIAPPADPKYPYVVDIRTRWRGSYFYFIGVYRDPRPDAISAAFEDPIWPGLLAWALTASLFLTSGTPANTAKLARQCRCQMR